MKEIELSPRALDDFDSLPPFHRDQILRKLYRFQATGAGDVKGLSGSLSSQSRLRVGDYRIFFERIGANRLRVIRVLNRRDAY